MYWRSGLPGEKYMNFWLLQLHAGLDPGAFPIRVAAYGLGAGAAASLCTLAGVVGPGLQVLSADARLATEVGQACPSAGIEVEAVPAH
ncbi:hypothetical protein [uncultured Leifsonia sp.]|uniref:hypothetical protein n=1 Tax=uncultured Leifsonia sp. TaxID=340359 RepID=UPI0025DDE955|nr:hypothetical protein [uncultured Leifsonia sp.]